MRKLRKLDLSPIPERAADGTAIKVDGEPKHMDPSDWIINRILGVDQVGQMQLGEIRARISIIDIVQAAGAEVLLEQGEWERLYNAAESFRHNFVSRAYVELCRRIQDAPEVEVAEVQAPGG